MSGNFDVNFAAIDDEHRINVKELNVGDITRFNNLGETVAIVVKEVSPCEDPEDVLVKAVTLNSGTLFSELEDIQFKVNTNTLFSYDDHLYECGVLFSEIDNDDPIDTPAECLDEGQITTIRDNDTRRDILITKVEKDEVANKVLIEAKVLDGSNESVKFSVDLDTVFSVKDFYDASSDTLFSDRDSAYDNTVCFGQVAYGQPQYVYDPTTRSYQLVYPQAPKKKHTGLKIAAGVLGAAALGLGAQAMYQKHKTGSFKGSWADKGIEGIKGLPRKFESKEKKEAREAQEKKDYDEKYKSDPVFKAEEDAKKRVKDAEDAALKKSSERATKRSGRKLDADIAHLNAHPELGTVAAARANRVDQMKAEHASKVITSIKNAGLEGKLLNKDGTINSEALEKHNTKYGAGHKKYIVAGKNNYTRDLDAKNESKKPKTKPDNQSQSQSQGTPRSNEQRRTKHDSKRAGKSPTQDTKPQQNTSNGKNGWTYSNIPRNKGETDENYGTRVRTIFPGLGNNTIGISDK